MEIRRTRAAVVCTDRSAFQRAAETMPFCPAGRNRSTAFATSDAARTKIFARARHRIRRTALATVVSPAHCCRAGRTRDSRARRAGRQLFRCRSLLDEKCTRLGVIFPSCGALSRLVADSLARLDIPHNDGLGHIVPGIFESVEWQAWLELQRAPRLNSFLRFLNALSNSAVLSP